jgi:Flp pilus assembly protein TadD
MSIDDRQSLLAELAGTQIRLVRHRDALETLRDAGDSADILALRGEAHLALGEEADGRACVERALVLDPNHLRALATKARFAFEANDPKSAVETLQKALAVHPRDSSLHLLMSQAEHRLGHEDQAEAHMAKYEYLHELATRFAELSLRAVMEPEQSAVRYQLGLVCEQLGRDEAAANWYRAALTLDPAHPGAASRLSALTAAADAAKDASDAHDRPGGD